MPALECGRSRVRVPALHILARQWPTIGLRTHPEKPTLLNISAPQVTGLHRRDGVSKRCVIVPAPEDMSCRHSIERRCLIGPSLPPLFFRPSPEASDPFPVRRRTSEFEPLRLAHPTDLGWNFPRVGRHDVPKASAPKSSAANARSGAPESQEKSSAGELFKTERKTTAAVTTTPSQLTQFVAVPSPFGGSVGLKASRPAAGGIARPPARPAVGKAAQPGPVSFPPPFRPPKLLLSVGLHRALGTALRLHKTNSSWVCLGGGGNCVAALL